MKTMVVAAVLGACLFGCQSSGEAVISVTDVYDQFSASKEALRAKYDGKEVVVVGKAKAAFDQNFYGLDTEDLHLLGDKSVQTVVCTVKKADADKFVGVKEGAMVTVKGTMRVKEFGVELVPCSRDARSDK